MGGSKRGMRTKGNGGLGTGGEPGNDDIVANQLGCEPFF